MYAYAYDMGFAIRHPDVRLDSLQTDRMSTHSGPVLIRLGLMLEAQREMVHRNQEVKCDFMIRIGKKNRINIKHFFI